MTVDPNEVARFKNALAKLSPAEIRRRLDGSIIVRPWKRSLAEAEGGRRDREGRAGQERSRIDAENIRQRGKAIARHVWLLVATAIVAAVALIWNLFPR
jgi:hypothetical protein